MHRFEVVTAGSGIEGLALAGERAPDLVICDLVMPDMDGFEVVDRLADSDMPKDVPILILTGQELGAEDRGQELDVGRYLFERRTGSEFGNCVGRVHGHLVTGQGGRGHRAGPVWGSIQAAQ